MVLLSHGRHFLSATWVSAEVFRIGGFLGVELFFVLSGFLIGGIVWRSFKDAPQDTVWVKGFLARRWLRTLPNYFLFLGVNALLIATALLPGHVSDLLPFVFFVQNLAWPHPPAFGEAWSLAVEEVFYLTFPLLLLLFGKHGGRKEGVFLGVIIMMLFLPLIARILAVTFTEPAWDAGVRKIVVFRLDSLMLGVVAGWLNREYRISETLGQGAFILAAVTILGAVLLIFFRGETFLNADAFARIGLFPLASLGFVFVLLAGLRYAQVRHVFNRPIYACARWSYALYLTHMPVFHIIVSKMGFAKAHDSGGAVLRWSLFMVCSFAIAALVEKWFERPILQWRDRVYPH